MAVQTRQGAKKRKNKPPKGLRGFKRNKLERRAQRSEKTPASSLKKTGTKAEVEEELRLHEMPYKINSKTKRMRHIVRDIKRLRKKRKQ